MKSSFLRNKKVPARGKYVFAKCFIVDSVTDFFGRYRHDKKNFRQKKRPKAALVIKIFQQLNQHMIFQLVFFFTRRSTLPEPDEAVSFVKFN